MVCGIQFQTTFPETAICVESLPDAKATCPISTGEWAKTFAFFEGLYITVTPSFDGQTKYVKVDGSLHKFYTGGLNNTTFTRSQCKYALRRLEKELSLSLGECRVQRIEIGVNICADDPATIIDDARLFNGRMPSQIERSKHFYGKVWEFGGATEVSYRVKLYRKDKHLLRFEVKLFRMRKLLPLQINTLVDLFTEDTWMGCLLFLHKQADLFLFMPIEGTEGFTDIAKTKWYKIRNSDDWNNLTANVRHDRKAWILRQIQQFGLYDAKALLAEGIIEQGAKMLDISKEAMLARLGSQAATIAVTCRDGNRKNNNTRAETSALAQQSSIQTFRGVDGYFPWTAPLQASSASTAHTPAAEPTTRSPPFLVRCNSFFL